MGVDPIAEKYAYVTTFNYAENEPVANIDLWGLQKVDMIWNDPNLKGATKEQYERFRYKSTKVAVGVVVGVTSGILFEFALGAIADVIASTKIGAKVLKIMSKVEERSDKVVNVKTRTTRTGDKGVRITRKSGKVKDITKNRVKQYEPTPKNPTGKPNKVNFKKEPNKVPKGSRVLKTDPKKRTPTNRELKILKKSKGNYSGQIFIKNEMKYTEISYLHNNIFKTFYLEPFPVSLKRERIIEKILLCFQLSYNQ